MESGEVEFTEWTQLRPGGALQGGGDGRAVPAGAVACSAPTRSATAPPRVIACPFTGETLAALPALYPDVAAIHVHEADRYGNCRIRGTTVADLDLARAAKRLIITCERLIPHDEIRRDPTRTVIPFFCVDAVCEVPYGSYPGNMPYEYFSDEEHLRAVAGGREGPGRRSGAFLDEYIFGVRDFAEYLQRCGGLPRMQELRRQEFLLHRGSEC